MVKQGPPPWKNWRKRWTVLTEDSIDYYKSAKTSTGLQGSVGLSIVNSIQLDSKGGRRKHCFSVVTPVRTYYFAAASDKAADEWVVKIRNAHEAFKTNKRVTIASIRQSQQKRKPTASELFESSGIVPSDAELLKLPKEELSQLMTAAVQEEEEAVEQIREAYALRLALLIEAIVEKELATVQEKYSLERKLIRAEIALRES